MIEVISLNNEQKWNEVVLSFKDYDVYSLIDYVKAFNIHGDGEPILIYYDDLKIRGINIVMKRDISKIPIFSDHLPSKKYYDIITPYGYGGFLIEGEVNSTNLEKLKICYNKFCRENGFISEFVRFNPVLDNVKYNEKNYENIELGKTITIPLSSPNTIWNNMSGKNRNVIRKAKKLGVEIFWGRTPELIDTFMDMYNTTMKRDNAERYYFFKKEFYESILNDLMYNSMIFYAVFDNKIISMAIILYGNEKIHYHLSASNREYQHLSATNLLLYEVACWGVRNQFKYFHLGGGLGSKEDNLFKFKKAFNPASGTSFSIGKKIFDMTVYQKLVQISKENKRDRKDGNFFPEYR